MSGRGGNWAHNACAGAETDDDEELICEMYKKK